MPTIDDIARVAESLEKSPVIVVRDRCVAVRNRNASCRKCVHACPVGAIDVTANELTLSASTCIACGACAAACPTEALVPVAPTDGDLLRDAQSTADRNGGTAVIACARIASKRIADPQRFAEVPCLSRVDEALVVQLVAGGASSVLLVDGNCATCKHRVCVPAMEAAVLHADSLLEAHGSDVRVQRRTGFPDDMAAESTDGLYGATRRGFFSQAAGAAKETALSAAKAKLESELGYKVDEPSIGARLRVTADGTLPQLSMARHEAAINALYALGQPDGCDLKTRLFGTVDIDVGKCNACGMCAVFCPTGALSRDPADKPSDKLRYFEFSAADCVQCGLCADVCWKGALKLSATVPADELYDFEPRTFDVAKASRKRKV